MRLDLNSYGVELHEVLAKIAEALGTYDQVNVSNLAGCELHFRHMHLVERYYDEWAVDVRVASGKQPIEEARAFRKERNFPPCRSEGQEEASERLLRGE